ncbi:hypothetical protein SADUNF_Sadunf16G0150600 [Salix dunnii]|uniref:NAD-dependent epimerase/dehydratase domain-containing protein n=1 Tax=Salix dunnii TaxID=1413687 RepID=A0A835J9U7_9ROSI|nr:hypothetical protein SADUNF_Sadunf16G0150600 [Salix dunnii]
MLLSCAKVLSIKRVAVTSCTAAVLYGRKPPKPDPAEYALSKTLAEEAAWKSKENATDLDVMNPAFVIGPPLHPTLNYSVEMIPNLVNGNELQKQSVCN